MQSQFVFQDKQEIERLAVQNRLLISYENKVLSELFSGRSDLKLLDIGCNDGKKTVDRFDSAPVSRVVGLEYNKELATRAQALYGNQKFSFYQCDAESAEFSGQLADIMKKNGIKGFDVIYLSFVLMHLSDPAELLKKLRDVLSPDGCLFVIEADDSASTLEPAGNELLHGFLDILEKDPYSGDRTVGKRLPELLKNSGFTDICIRCDSISAGNGEKQKKADIFTTFFSYLPEDVAILREKHSGEQPYNAWSEWLDDNYAALHAAVTAEDSRVSMGMCIVTCKRGSL